MILKQEDTLRASLFMLLGIGGKLDIGARWILLMIVLATTYAGAASTGCRAYIHLRQCTL